MAQRAAQTNTDAQEAGFAPRAVLRVHGMRRSGNHAIINWLARNTSGGTVFLNNCRQRRHPFDRHASVEIYQKGALCPPDKGTPLAERLALAGPAPLALVSYEDEMPRPRRAGPWPDAPGGEQVVIIYRSFLNWSASLLRKISDNPGYGALERLRVMTNACRTYGEALRAVAAGHATGLCYDQWFTDEAYRTDRLDVLNLPHQDNTLGDVQRYGGGSSFQGKAATAAELNTDRRADAMAGNSEYQVLLWIVAHDAQLMETIAGPFPEDAERLLRLANDAEITAPLPLQGAWS